MKRLIEGFVVFTAMFLVFAAYIVIVPSSFIYSPYSSIGAFVCFALMLWAGKVANDKIASILYYPPRGNKK